MPKATKIWALLVGGTQGGKVVQVNDFQSFPSINILVGKKGEEVPYTISLNGLRRADLKNPQRGEIPLVESKEVEGYGILTVYRPSSGKVTGGEVVGEAKSIQKISERGL